MKLKSYPKTKPSGVEWLGEVPEHWEVKRLSYLAMLKSGENITSEMIAEGGAYPVYGGNGLRGNYHKFTHRGHYALIGRQGALCGNINYADGEFYASEHALVVIPLKEFAVGWIGELLRAMNLGQYSVTAAQPGISAEVIRSLRIAVPSLKEQTAIAAYLDRETGRIDELVGKKRELIERLKEKSTALISRTVIRGLPADLPPSTLAKLEQLAGEKLRLNPNLKPSGIEWLGDVPEHWETAKTKRHVSILSGFAFPSNEFTRDDEDMRLLRGINVGVSQIRWDETVCWNRTPGDGLSRFELSEGELVIGMDRPWVTEGVRVAILTEADVPCLLLQRVAALRTDKHLSTTFLYRLLSSPMFVDYFTPEMTGVSVPHISPGQIGDFPIPVPPLPEQRAIAAYLDEETAKLDALVAKVETAIERLQEYRTALITAAVTGKIDVRMSNKN